MEFAAGIELGSIPKILYPIFFSWKKEPEQGIWGWDRKNREGFWEELANSFHLQGHGINPREKKKSLGINDLQKSGLNSPRDPWEKKKAGKGAGKAVRSNGMAGNELRREK